MFVLQLAVHQTPEVQHLIVPEKLHIAGIGRRRHQRRMHVVEPVRAHDRTVAGGRGGDSLPFGNTTADLGIGLQDGGSTFVQQLLVVPASIADLGRRHRNACQLGQPDVAMELLSERTGIQMTHVPYKGGVPALQDLVSGRVQAMADSLPQLLPYVKEGRLRAIAVTGAQRSEYLPDIMTATESGVSDYVLYGWLGIFAPISTPLELRQRLNTTFNGVIASKPYQDFLLANYSPIVATMSLPEFEAFVRKEYARWGQVVRTANIRLE